MGTREAYFFQITTLAHVSRGLIVTPDYKGFRLLGNLKLVVDGYNWGSPTIYVVKENFVEYLGAEALSDGKKTRVIK